MAVVRDLPYNCGGHGIGAVQAAVSMRDLKLLQQGVVQQLETLWCSRLEVNGSLTSRGSRGHYGGAISRCSEAENQPLHEDVVKKADVSADDVLFTNIILFSF
jgi:hypothetical protein